MISFCLITNRRCQTRFIRYYDEIPQDPAAFELNIARECIVRKPGHVRLCFFYFIKKKKNN